MKQLSLWHILVVSVVSAGCVAQLGGSDDTQSRQGKENRAPGQTDALPGGLPNLDQLNCDELEADPGEVPLRLLSRKQYENTLAALGLWAANVSEVLPVYHPPSTLGVPQAPINAVEVEAYGRAAETIAAYVVADPTRLDQLAPCAEGSAEESCAEDFIRNFGEQAYRAKVEDPEDIEQHLSLFRIGLETSYARGIELLLRGMLQSARFLYQLEIGTSEAVGKNAVRLRPHELAARLSYSIWNTPPDAELLEAATSGQLDDAAGLSAELDRMLSDPRGEEFVRLFLEEWTQLSRVKSLYKSEELYPNWGAMQQPVYEQARAFFDHILKQRDGSLEELFTSNEVMVGAQLAPYYGVTAEEGFQPRTDLPGAASGLLTLPAWLASFSKQDESSPIHRGVFIRGAVLCQNPPAPPGNIPDPPEVDSGGSTRERLQMHVSEPACRNCHELFDPIGLGLENYDAVGFFRDEDGGKPVDASGELIGTDVDASFEGPIELGQLLAKSPSVEQCVARQWFRFASSRFEKEADLCSLKKLVDALRDSNQNLNSLPAAFAHSDAFLYRRPSDAEVQP